MPSADAAAVRRAHALRIFKAAVRAADPAACVRRALTVARGQLQIGDLALPLDKVSRLVVLGAGKATAAMAVAAEEILGDAICAGAINTKYGHALPLERLTTAECGHPIPDEAGVTGALAMLDLLEGLDERALVLCLFSGGGSALMPAPAEGITLEQKQATTRLLLECGATIDQVNAVRKHLSRVKGGQLARLARPAAVVSLMISDVIGDRLDTIASGPTYPDSTTFGDCLDLARQYDILQRLPTPVRQRLEAGAAGDLEETPRAGDEAFATTHNFVVGNNALALQAAQETARQLGYRTLVLSSRIAGETRDVAGVHAAIAQEVAATGQPVEAPACIISGGETTVTIRGQGKGGRNQEFALAAAMELDGTESITALSGGTDGTDGPTDAAGAVADGTTVARARDLGLSAAEHLSANNSYAFFEPLGDLLMTGPTGTNVMDLRLLLIT